MLPLKRKTYPGEIQPCAPSTSRVEREAKPQESRECAGHKTAVFNGLARLKSKGEFCDFVIVIEGEEIPVHRAVLAASSKYFEAMLGHNTKERKNGHVRIHGISLAAGKQCVEFIYTGKARFSCENPEKLIYAAELMHLPALTDMYFEYLKENLGAENCLGFLQIAEKFGRESYADIFSKFTVTNFQEIVGSDDFAKLGHSFFKQCLQSLNSKDVDVEHLKWKAILKWVRGDPEKRAGDFFEYFELLKLEHFDDNFLRESILKDPLVNRSEKCKELILNSLLQPDRHAHGHRFPANKNSACIVAISPEGILLKRRVGDHASGWSRRMRIPMSMVHDKTDLVSVGARIFLSSGNSLYQIRNDNLVYHSDPGVQLGYHRALVHRSSIYIVTSQRVLKYDTLENSWSTISASLGLGEGFFAALSDKYIYAMGGGNSLKTAKEFDFETRNWCPISSLRHGRTYGAAVVKESNVYAIGGTSETNCAECYCIVSNQWSNLLCSSGSSTIYECKFFRCKAFLIGREIYVVGGGGCEEWILPYKAANRYLSRCCYTLRIDTAQAHWSGVDSMLLKNGISCVVYD